MSEHTKGCLKVNYPLLGWGVDIDTEDGFTLAENLKPADALRLAACWNAFENVRTELVEAMIGTGAMQAASEAMSALPAVQSELAAARALLRRSLNVIASNPPMSIYQIVDDLRSYLDACDTLGSGHG